MKGRIAWAGFVIVGTT